MVFVNIPYYVENDRIDRAVTQKELQVLDISEDQRYEAFAAIYNKLPRGVEFSDPKKAMLLEAALSRLGVPFRQTPESEHKFEGVHYPDAPAK